MLPLPVRAAGRAKPAFVGRAAETAAAEQGWAARLPAPARVS